jgi:hypothetical protein
MCCLDAESYLYHPPVVLPHPQARAEPEGGRASPAIAAAVTITVAGTALEAGETLPPATETPRQAVRMKRAIKKKSVL